SRREAASRPAAAVRGYQRGLLAAADNGARGAYPNADDHLFARGDSYHRAERGTDERTYGFTDCRGDEYTHRGSDRHTDGCTDRDVHAIELTHASVRARAPGRGRADARSARPAARAATRAGDQRHRPQPRRTQHHRRTPGRVVLAPGLAVQPRTRHPRRSRGGPAPIAMRYGLTIGELGHLFNGELGVGAELTVVQLQGWRRSMWFDQTELSWVNPSPNLRSLPAAALYPGIVLVEGTNLSEGRGTERPFEWIGAPWLDGQALADALNGAALAGVRFRPSDQTPDSSKFAGQACRGVIIEVV